MACPPEHIGPSGHVGSSEARYYVKPADLVLEIRHSRRTKTISPRLGQMLLDLAERYSQKPNWAGYSYREDFVGAAMPHLCRAVFKLNPEKNPFAYLTQTVHNAFLKELRKEKKHSRPRQAAAFFDLQEED